MSHREPGWTNVSRFNMTGKLKTMTKTREGEFFVTKPRDPKVWALKR